MHSTLSESPDIISVEEVSPKEDPEQRGPRQNGSEKALDRAIAATVPRPAGNAEHGDTSAHRQHGQRDSAQLTYRCHGHLRMKAEQEW